MCSILVGGLLMLTPGFVLDIVGLVCILPFTRPVGRRLLSGFIGRRLVGASYLTAATSSFSGPRGSGTDPRTQQRPGPDEGVVQGEVVD